MFRKSLAAILFKTLSRSRVRFAGSCSLLFACLMMTYGPARAQSTFGSVFGTVTDPQAAVIGGASVKLTNTGTGATRSTVTNQEGAYAFPNVDAGVYELTIEARGFEKARVVDLALQARESRRMDAVLQLGATNQSITVEAHVGTVVTDESSISQTKTGRELVDLPLGLTSRSRGSTSPFSALSTEPGVQPASNTSMVIFGATPAMQSGSIDGISNNDVEQQNIISELLPSFNAISEIRISESNMNAEYSSVVDVSATTKGGGNRYHGGLTENYESKGFNADNWFAARKPNLVMNDFGAYAGGPLSVPHLYNGHNKTFFFVDYEGLRLPQSTTVIQTVPTAEMRAGNVCAYLDAVDQVAPGNEPSLFMPNGTQIPCNAVPVSSVAANVMKYLYPTPTAPGIVNNFSQVFPTSTKVNQGDARIDQSITSRQSMFARYTYKRSDILGAPYNAVFGSLTTSQIFAGIAIGYTYTMTPQVVNEIRVGENGQYNVNSSYNSNAGQLLAEIGITGIADIPNAAVVPLFQPGYTESSTGNGIGVGYKTHIVQLFDNLTWVKGRHTMKFGADVRRLTQATPAIGAFGPWAVGEYDFSGASVYAQTAANPSGMVGDAFTEFLLGYPDSVLLSASSDPGMNAWAYAGAFYAQDKWDITKDFTLDFGLRYELHPPLQLHGYNDANFIPDYMSTINGVTAHGAVVVPNQQGLSIVEPAFAASIAPTPIFTAAQAGLPVGLRFTDKTDFGPRLGFAWRPFHDSKTVIRGGWGRFISPPMGASAYFGWAVPTSNNETFFQSYNTATGPGLTFPNPFTGPNGNITPIGTQNFADAVDWHYRDPVVYEWNFTVERELGGGVGLRLGYVGSHGTLLNFSHDLNQIAPNTTGYEASSAARPYPLWSYLQTMGNGAESNYNSLSAVFTKRLSNGLQFQSSYTFTRDLSDAGGAAPTGLATIQSLINVGSSWGASPRLDYGNVTYDRRHRFLTTFLYDLPFGEGKRFLAAAPAFVKNVVGGWTLSGILIDQSGSFLTITEDTTDPSGTGQGGLEGNYPSSRVDIIPGVSPYLSNAFKGKSPRGIPEPLFLNAAAFAVPPSNIGRWGTEPVGYLTGPGQHIVSLSMLKTIRFSEHARLQLGCSAANVLNHPNYGNPVTDLTSGQFGIIRSFLSNESGGPRFLQFTARVIF